VQRVQNVSGINYKDTKNTINRKARQDFTQSTQREQILLFLCGLCYNFATFAV
jgi:hypothetical protein